MKKQMLEMLLVVVLIALCCVSVCNASVVSGKTYTLKTHGTIGGVAFTSTPVTKTCPQKTEI